MGSMKILSVSVSDITEYLPINDICVRQTLPHLPRTSGIAALPNHFRGEQQGGQTEGFMRGWMERYSPKEGVTSVLRTLPLEEISGIQRMAARV